MEIISGVERRRRWRAEDKLRIVAEVEQPGASFVEVARRYDVSRGLLWNWREQVRRGTLAAPGIPPFLAVHVPPERVLPVASDHAEAAIPDRRVDTGDGLIEIVLPDGVVVRVKGEVAAPTLRNVLGVLRG